MIRTGNDGHVLVMTMSLAVLAATTGCTPYDGEESGLEPIDVERQAVRESSYDRPVAAAVKRLEGPPYRDDLWVFACNSDHQMMRNIAPSYALATPGGTVLPSWLGWERISGRTCASPPTVGVWTTHLNAPSNDVVLVYWRDNSGNLIEFRYYEDGHTTSLNLSSMLRIGAIIDNPAVANVGDDFGNGVSRAVSVVFKRSGSNELWTADYKDGAWATYPVLRSNGATATGRGNTFATAFGGNPSDSYDRSYISMQFNSSDHIIYSRQNWDQSYVQYAVTQNAPPNGLLSIAGRASFDGGDACWPRGCAMFRRLISNELWYASLTDGGVLSFKRYADNELGPSTIRTMGGSLVTAPDERSWPIGVARSSDGHMMTFAFPAWTSTSCIWSPLMTSAPNLALNVSGRAFYADVNNQLTFLDFFHANCDATPPLVTNLGLTPLVQ
jgi:hypothetical protein